MEGSSAVTTRPNVGRPAAPSAPPRPSSRLRPPTPRALVNPSAPPVPSAPPERGAPPERSAPPPAPSSRSSGPPISEAAEARSSRPRLELAPLTPAELLYERLQEPSDDSPILYRERAYLVDTLQTDDDLEEHLEAELSRIRRDWRNRDASQFVHLALFDHRFQGEPELPPIATLSWKDWQGRSEIWVRGVRRSTLPPGVPLTQPPALRGASSAPAPGRSSFAPVDLDAEIDEIDDVEPLEDSGDGAPPEAGVAAERERVERTGRTDSEPIPLVTRGSATPASAPASARHSLPAPADEAEPPDRAREGAPPDSGPGWQSPDRSGEYLIPLPEEAPAPPSSQRVLASDELLGALFERLHELSYITSIAAGADYVLGTLVEHLPCDGALISVLDERRAELVVLRAAGAGADARELIGQRLRSVGSHLELLIDRRQSLQLGPVELERAPGLWPALGLSPRHAIASPVQRHGRLLGAIELCRGAEKGPFGQGHVSALEYTCEQLSDFIGDRAIELPGTSSVPRP